MSIGSLTSIRREQLEQMYLARSNLERVLLDSGVGMYILAYAMAALWAVELIHNVTAGRSDWIFVVHLLVIGAIECFILWFFLVRAVTAAWLKQRLRKLGSSLVEKS